MDAVGCFTEIPCIMTTPTEGAGGFPEITLNNEHGSARISSHGGHVLEYQPAGQRPVLWTSEQAVFRADKAIRGGIPVCWPWFADHASDPGKPAHGVARTADWEFTEISNDAVILRLTDSEATRAHWPHTFNLALKVTLGEQLSVALSATNRSADPVHCTAALHSYFAISNVANIRIDGLAEGEYIDSIDNDQRKVQNGPINIDREVDRIYINTEAETIIRDEAWQREIVVAKSGSKSTVVWNPWIDKAARMSDFGNEEYLNMVCVETCNAGTDVIEIPSGATHTLTALLSSRGI